VALIFLQNVCFQACLDDTSGSPDSDLERFYQVTREIILDSRSVEEIDEQEKLLLKIKEKIKIYQTLQGTLTEEIQKITTTGEQPE
jgi:hypothetical protein